MGFSHDLHLRVPLSGGGATFQKILKSNLISIAKTMDTKVTGNISPSLNLRIFLYPCPEPGSQVWWALLLKRYLLVRENSRRRHSVLILFRITWNIVYELPRKRTKNINADTDTWGEREKYSNGYNYTARGIYSYNDLPDFEAKLSYPDKMYWLKKSSCTELFTIFTMAWNYHHISVQWSLHFKTTHSPKKIWP